MLIYTKYMHKKRINWDFSKKINKAFSYLEQSLERPPSADEIAKELDMTVAKVKLAMKNSGRNLSMDAPFKEGENDSNLYDVLNEVVVSLNEQMDHIKTNLAENGVSDYASYRELVGFYQGLAWARNDLTNIIKTLFI